MQRPAALLLLIMVILTASTSVALAKPGIPMELVCFIKPDGSGEHWSYFMMTSSGIVHRFKLDGRHDIYKPVSKFKEPGGGDWKLWTAKLHDPCNPATDGSHENYLPVGTQYWHRHN
jgi:hypothetical protein